MYTSNYYGDVIIEPSKQGLMFAVGDGQQLTFAGEKPNKNSWRLVASAAISLILLSLPSFSLAATYTSADLVARTNAVRTEHGLSSLTVSPALEQAAIAKANDMFAQNYFGHYSPTGVAPWTFFHSANYSFTAAGENLAADYVDGADIVPAWLASKTHRDNLLNPAYRDIGIAVLDGTINGSPTTVVVQFFGNRQSTAITTPTPIVTKPVPIPPVKKLAPKAAPVTQAPAPIQVPVDVISPVIVPTPIIQPVTIVPPFIEQAQAAEIKGVSTEVIPTLTLRQTTPSVADPRIVGLILSTFGLYATILTGAALMNGLLRASKKESTWEPSLILA